MGSVLKKFLDASKNRKVKVFFQNGFQLSGTLIGYDDSHILLRTNEYGNGKEIPVSIASITTYVPL